MKISEFLSQRYGAGSPSVALSTRKYACHALLPDEVRQAANLGWKLYPVTLLAKLGACRSDLQMKPFMSYARR